MTKIDTIHKTLDLANYVFYHPSDLLFVSHLIEMLTDNPVGIDKKLINKLDTSKTVPSEVKDITSVIIANLNVLYN